MSEVHRKRRRIWVDGVEYGTERDAARAAGVAISSLHEALKFGRVTINGREITDKPPAPRTAELKALSRKVMKLPAEGKRPPLIRWPPGETPLEMWNRKWR
ncbi:MAG: hypothetical protein LBF74_05685 [Treponema sp.]|nr:hypothetical protein [Treponema sp.]